MRHSELKLLSEQELTELALKLWDKLKQETGSIDLFSVTPFNETRSNLNRVLTRLDKARDWTSPWGDHDGIEQNILNWIKG
ncbi:hypothetical protein FDI69_gp130 [Rhodococcus phage Trina]|uniref:Uncharacterized protein n=1 Tax=Rhodococcus phage Trina TaxID=2027905 RepID=A0A2D0ZMC4_9CAUD|nr:hypothetical protein FDI69_gp130 [Rhodococcus phage Trina]ASZ75055.1 hypothetical protein SEA_TRINA_277 [Rhodococcus phage Trina]